MKWISVEDRLPNDLVSVLGYVKDQDFITHTCIEKGFWRELYHDEDYLNVTHWQPLPQPPKN